MLIFHQGLVDASHSLGKRCNIALCWHCSLYAVAAENQGLLAMDDWLKIDEMSSMSFYSMSES